jgi:hypothetical protein
MEKFIVITKQDIQRLGKEMTQFIHLLYELTKIVRENLAKEGKYLDDAMLFELVYNSLPIFAKEFPIKKKARKFLINFKST